MTNGRDGKNYIYPTDYDCIILEQKLQEPQEFKINNQINNRYYNNSLLL